MNNLPEISSGVLQMKNEKQLLHLIFHQRNGQPAIIFNVFPVQSYIWSKACEFPFLTFGLFLLLFHVENVII